jgi:CheY-like chemotaxis protein
MEKIILLVEDNPDDEALTLRALKKHNVANNIIIAHDGVEALRFLFGSDGQGGGETREPPALVLLDLKLPKLDGLEVLRRVRADERTRRLPVVVLTSSKEEQDLINSYNIGANSYIRKPVDFTQFTESVKQLGLYWMILNESAPR